MTNRPLLLATLEGYAVEGGFDHPFQPATCFSPTVALGRHAGPGLADGLWSDYEVVLDLAAQLGLDGVRLGVEWARVEPHRGEVDVAALDRYAGVVRHARSQGLHVTLALVDAAWPAWLGLEAWLLPWVVPHVLRHAQRVVEHLGADVQGVIAFARANELVERGYLEATMPPWRRGALADARSAEAQIEQITRLLVDDHVVGPLMVRHAMTLDLESDALRVARADARLDEVHLRSLVKGAGPTSAASGLLVKHHGQWAIGPAAAVLDAR